jgi:hypothetical protein
VVFAIVAFGTWAVFRFAPRRGVSSSNPVPEAEPQPELLTRQPR